LLFASPCITELRNSPFLAGSTVDSVSFSPLINNKFFIAGANLSSNNITVYTLDTQTGIVNQVLGSPFDAPNSPLSITFSPLVNNTLFAATSGMQQPIALYTVDTSTGIFTPVNNSTTTRRSVNDVVFSPLINNRFYLATADGFSQTISVYSCDQFGALTPAPGSPYTADGYMLSAAYSPVIDTRCFVAAINSFNNTVSVFGVNSDGSLTPVSNSPFNTGSGPSSISFSPVIQNKIFAAITASYDNTVTVYNVDPNTGNFSSGTVWQFDQASSPTSAAFTIWQNTLILAVATLPNNIFFFSITPDTGALQLINGPVQTSTGSFIASLALSPEFSGNAFCATANFNLNNISLFQISTVLAAPVLTTASLNSLDNTVFVQGTNALPNALITLFADSTNILGTGTADATGNFSFNSSSQLPVGTHPVSVSQTVNNCMSVQSNSISVDPVAPTMGVALIYPQNGSLVYTNQPRFTGHTIPFSTVTLYITGNTIFTNTTQADQIGNWSLRANTPLSAGTYTATITALDPNSITSTVTVQFSVALISSFAQTIINKYGSL